MKSIVNIFRHIFVPHIHNDYKPHFFREISVASILVVVIVLLSVSFGSKLYIENKNMTAEVLPAVLVDLTNKDRSSNGEPSLTRNSVLDTAAQLKAQDMANSQYFAHTSPTGVTPWHWFSQVGYYFTYAGENLAIDFNESADVENAWLNSPKHKENIMSTNFTEIGIATAQGYYNGSPTTFVVQMFGTPAFIPTAEAETIPIVPITPPVVTPKPKPVIKKPTPVPTPVVPVEEVAIAPVVKGESAIAEEELKIVTETNDFIAVKNTAVNEEVIPVPEKPITPVATPKYSTWQERLVFLIPNYTDRIYKIFFWVVIIALMIMTIVEIRRQHLKNITYAILLIVIIFCFIYLNQSLFITSLLT